ncbi:MAG: hypothetical protein ACKOXO_10370 [Cyanobium sp.]
MVTAFEVSACEVSACGFTVHEAILCLVSVFGVTAFERIAVDAAALHATPPGLDRCGHLLIPPLAAPVQAVAGATAITIAVMAAAAGGSLHPAAQAPVLRLPTIGRSRPPC